MMLTSKISEKIPQQNFSVIGQRIGHILSLELQGQYDQDNFDAEYDVYYSRITPPANDEELFFNVYPSKADYTNKNTVDVSSETQYFIDIVSFASNSGINTTGSINSTNLLHNAIGLVRYIFSHPEWSLLGFDPGVIAGVYVDEFAIENPSFAQDSNYGMFARLVLTIRHIEENNQIIGIPLLENHTKVNLEKTEKGYKFIKIFKNE